MKAFSYQDFYKFFERLTIIATNEKKEYDYFSIIKPFIEKPYDYFWEELYLENLRSNVHDITTPGLLSLMCMNYIPPSTSKLRNKYYENEYEYEKTKNNLKNCSVTFNISNVKDLSKTFRRKYDKIFLSNIADYLDITTSTKELYEIIVDNIKPLLNKNGECLSAYTYNYTSDNQSEKIRFKFNPNGNYSIFEKNLRLIKVNNINVCGEPSCQNKDAVLVYRKR